MDNAPRPPFTWKLWGSCGASPGPRWLRSPLDVVLTPTLALPPVPLGYFTASGDPADEFEKMNAFTPFGNIANITGQPAVNVPSGTTADGLPLGMMLLGRIGAEATLISLSAQLEAARPWRDRTPEVWHR